MTTDLHRLAQYFQVPISPPADPFEAMFEKGAPPLHLLYVNMPVDYFAKLMTTLLDIYSGYIWVGTALICQYCFLYRTYLKAQ